ncbi:MAG: flagellar export chaperone FlgN [Idiomarina sp.]
MASPNSSNRTTETLEQLLDKLRQNLQELARLQQQELAAVVEHQHDVVAQSTAAKQQLLHAIEQLDARLAKHPDVERLKNEPELTEQMAGLKQQLADCQQQNQVNDQVVKVTLSRIEQLRDTLIRAHNRDSVTYDDKGRIR